MASAEQQFSGMRVILGWSDAKFRSMESQRAIEHVVNKLSDAIFTLSTGCGKSMLFRGPLYIFKDWSIILIITLLALQEDIVKQYAHKRTQAWIWIDRYAHGNRLVICSVEHVRSTEYSYFIKEKYKLAMLGGIFIDDVHLIEQWKSFRPLMMEINNKIRPGGVSVPLYVFSGTSPHTLYDYMV